MTSDTADRIATPPRQDAGLSIGTLSRLTGVTVASIRTWELRYGFPEAVRLPSGHRRYSYATVDAVAAVARDREAGTPLGEAISEARAPHWLDRSSVYLAVRRLNPHLQFQRLTSATLLAISRAIEDECCARSHAPVLFGGFQREARYEPHRARWNDLGRTARAAFVLADFADEAPEDDLATRVALSTGSPLLRERFVVCDAGDVSALLIASELPGQTDRPEPEREYEAFWTFEPKVVRDASRICAVIALAAGVPHAEELVHQLAEPRPHQFDPAQSVLVFNRIVGYIDQGLQATPPARET